MYSLFITLVLILSLSQNSNSFPMSCKNANASSNVVPGDPLEFHCTSEKKYHSCVIEREMNGGMSHCNFTFYQPLQFGAEYSNPRKELKRVGWDCKLDTNPYRIQVLEKNNEMVCRLRINIAKLSGKKVVSVFCCTCISP